MAGRNTYTTQQEDHARVLYFYDKNLTSKAIAERVGASERAVVGWIKKGKWESLRLSMILSRADQLARLYNILRAITDKIEEQNGIGDTKLADMMIKYTAAIRNLETDTSIAEIVEVMIKFMDFIQHHHPQHHRLITDISDEFVRSNL
ncbi:hypothetical protein GCM10023093_16910 [Nemorincola caseinilytica]|uniref:Uncharacterized protein n=1 Tax=Nemorincola caseinilytica TaxID=2054315 RepID=A0ABP8NG23_9BACT